MSNIIYSTELPPEIIKAYNFYISQLDKYGKGQKTNAAFLEFCKRCEEINKIPLMVANELSK